MSQPQRRPESFPPQHQSRQPGKTSKMNPKPEDCMVNYLAAGKLEGKNAIITGGDSGIGRAIAIGFAKEGANVVINYLSEDEQEDAEFTKRCVEDEGVNCLLVPGDIGDAEFCKELVAKAVEEFDHIHILINNAAEQHVQEKLEDITPEQLERTYKTNIFGAFFLTQAALSQMEKGDCIINTTSITAYKGNVKLIDYSSTKGAILTFTRSLSQSLAEKGIRVNAVAPGPIWTPLIPSSFEGEDVAKFGSDTPMKRAGQPDEVAPAFIFLASNDASYITGQVIHPNGGTMVNG